MSKLINILIRHKEGRSTEIDRCFQSIKSQTYPTIRVIVSSENNGYAYNSTLKNDMISVPYQHYNLHCNDLKAQVTDGWFFYLDDDDYLYPGSLEHLSHHLFEGALICQFLRRGLIKKPSDKMISKGIIQKGMIGGGCLVLHHSFKDVADWKAKAAADYDWIKAVTDIVPTRFVPLVLQITDNNGRHGK